MSKTIINIKNLDLKFGKKKVLDKVNIQFKEGETILIAGNNGAGKSSLLRCLGGVLLADGGEIEYAESVSPEKIAFLSDKMSFFQDYTLRQGIAFHCRAFNIEKFDDSMLKELNLDQDMKIKELSNGERALFQLSLLMSQKPVVLLLDEIIHIIDPYLREMFLDGLIDMIDEYKTTVIMINHTFSDMGRLPERVLIMEDGKFIFDEMSSNLPNRIKKVYTDDKLDAKIPVIYEKRSPISRECIIYPYEEKMAKDSGYEFHDVELTDIVKSFIGGYYAKKRI